MSSGTGKTLYTIGYGGRSVEEIAYILRAYKIGVMIDVRAEPNDPAAPQWDRANLEKVLPQYDLAYLWMGKELGVAQGQTDYDRIERSPVYAFGIASLSRTVTHYAEGAPDAPYCVLLSAETDPLTSLRDRLIARTLRDSDWTVHHILSDGSLT